MMRWSGQAPDGRRGALQYLDEAVHLLRQAPLKLLLGHQIGVLPFILGLLYFWTDMSRGAFAEERCGAAAFTLALLFLWMKFWQAVFAQGLGEFRRGAADITWDARRAGRLLAAQAIIQPLGLAVLPASLLLPVVGAWTGAFFQHVTALELKAGDSIGDLVRDAWRQTILFPLENCRIMFFLGLFTLFVFLNLVVALFWVPELLSTLLGVETLFTRGVAFLFNSTFLAVAVGLTYWCVDPLFKAVYVLRCFYGRGMNSGEDLAVELRSVRRRPGMVAAMAGTAAAARLSRSASKVKADVG